MKIIHISDLHIDSKMETNFSPQKARERNNEILGSFERLFTIMETQNYDAMIIAGDMFDTKKATSKSFSYILELILRHPTKMFFYVAGNHDNESLLINSVDNLPKNLIIFNSSFSKHKLSKLITIGGIQVTKSNVDSLGNQLSFNFDDINILVLHGNLTKTSSKVDDENISIDELKNKNIDYLALGHIHSYSSGKIDSRCQYAYSGCLEPRGFDEFGDKGFISIEIDEKNKKVTHKFIPHAMRKFIEVTVDITGKNNPKQILDTTLESLSQISEKNIVKVTLIGEYDEYTVKGLDLIQSELSNKFYFVKVQDKTKLKISLDDYKGSLTLKSIFIKKVLESKKIPAELKDDIIITGIKALEKEEID